MKKLFTIFLTLTLPCFAVAQKFAIKNNLLYDATATLNLGVEAALGHRATLDISGNYNPFEFGDTQWKHWLVQPELRIWTCEKFNGHFFGIHGFYGEYDLQDINFIDKLKDYRYKGHAWGAGLSYGYQWILSDRWNFELTAGVGYAQLWDKKYPMDDHGTVIRERYKDYIGPTKLGITIIFFIK